MAIAVLEAGQGSKVAENKVQLNVPELSKLALETATLVGAQLVERMRLQAHPQLMKARLQQYKFANPNTSFCGPSANLTATLWLP